MGMGEGDQAVHYQVEHTLLQYGRNPVFETGIFIDKVKMRNEFVLHGTDNIMVLEEFL